jgi:hypothetical protein
VSEANSATFPFSLFPFPLIKRLVNELAGDHTVGETPDPIPNSEAKPNRPMIVPWAKVGYRRHYEALLVNSREGFFFFIDGLFFCLHLVIITFVSLIIEEITCSR